MAILKFSRRWIEDMYLPTCTFLPFSYLNFKTYIFHLTFKYKFEYLKMFSDYMKLQFFR